MKLALVIDKAQIEDVRRRLGNLRELAPRVLVTTINKTLPYVRTQIKRAAQDVLMLPSNQILHTMTVVKANKNNVSGRIYVHRKHISMMQFKPKQQADGVVVKVRKSGPTFIPHGFIATMPNGHTGVFVRGADTHRVRKYNPITGKRYWSSLPIKEKQAPTVTDVLTEDPSIMPRIEADAQRQLMKNLDSQVDWMIAREADKN